MLGWTESDFLVASNPLQWLMVPENVTETKQHFTNGVKQLQQRENLVNYVWNSQLSIASNDGLEVVGTVVAVFTQMEAERPIRWHHWSTNHSCVLLNYVVGSRAKKYIHVKHATDCAERDSRQRLKFHLCTRQQSTHTFSKL